MGFNKFSITYVSIYHEWISFPKKYNILYKIILFRDLSQVLFTFYIILWFEQLLTISFENYVIYI